ncbi:hypothetical protein CLF_100123 [Clonorchis sinensis]|uniref:Uncharacterized protein n=1 Tax=Clonorchis sinensis TaxID=79923 RepID=G7Y2Q6_CLOSI|nr:hypothetical protein CLF_100123 [Clonorchis sinensis]
MRSSGEPPVIKWSIDGQYFGSCQVAWDGFPWGNVFLPTLLPNNTINVDRRPSKKRSLRELASLKFKWQALKDVYRSAAHPILRSDSHLNKANYNNGM